MEMQEIPRSHWPAFLEQFSRLHHGQPAQIESASPDMSWPHARQLPLLGVTAQAENKEMPIGIAAGDEAGIHMHHLVEHPARVTAAEWNDGVSGLLEIAAEDGTLTRIQVGPPEQTIPPGAILDGLYERE
jgi:uncharacterized protein DUF5335